MEGLATAAGHEDRQEPLKNYCQGLLLPGERKSIEPMAARLDPKHIQPMRQSLHHLVAKAPWSDAVLLGQVCDYVLPAMRKQGPVEAWIVDDTGFPKEGQALGWRHSSILRPSRQARELPGGGELIGGELEFEFAGGLSSLSTAGMD